MSQRYALTIHAKQRLYERTSLTEDGLIRKLQAKVFEMLVATEKYGQHTHQLIWDNAQRCLIDVPVINEGSIIPTIKIARTQSSFEEFVLAMGEFAWRGDSFFKLTNARICRNNSITVTVGQESESGNYHPLLAVITWFSEKTTEIPDDLFMNLYRDLEFVFAVYSSLQEVLESGLRRYDPEMSIVVNIYWPGVGVRHVPAEFFEYLVNPPEPDEENEN